MKLTQMQDIGGCRAVMRSVLGVHRLDRFYTKQSDIKHVLASRDDYIESPRKTGYRGIHLVYRYFSDKKTGAKYNGLKIEMQLRSQYQHAWATTVETVGTFIGEPLKSDSGPEEWRRFFALMGSVIALRERTSLVPDTPTDQQQLIEQLHESSTDLNVLHLLKGFADTLRKVEEAPEQAHYYLLRLDPGASQLTVTGFKQEEFEKAQQAYSEAEQQVKEHPGTDAVLVSVDSLAVLPRAYPNYFADTRVFVRLLEQALSGRPKRIFTGQLKLDAVSS
jgi:RelA/SpoT family protein